MSPIQQMLLGVGAVATKTYVDDVFSTYLFEGNGSGNGSATTAKTITNNIDLTKNGLVWIKRRDGTHAHQLSDTVRGVQKTLESHSTSAEYASTGGITSFTSTGFTLANDDHYNGNGFDMSSWTFRKAPKFFTIKEFTGSGSNQYISHDLGSVPGLIIIKSTSASGNWIVFHRSLGKNKYLRLSSGEANSDNGDYWGNYLPTATQFRVGVDGEVNSNNVEYIAYIFAHHDSNGTFGESGDKDIIKCGSYTGNGSTTGPEINLGWEPQWLLFKNSDSSSESWWLFDSMRGIVTGGNDKNFWPNLNNEEYDSDRLELTATGFKNMSADSAINGNGDKIIYIAIRSATGTVTRPPELGTDVFALDTGNSSSTGPAFDSTFAVDFSIMKQPAAVLDWRAFSRLTAERNLAPDTTSSEGAEENNTADYSDGIGKNYTDVWQAWMWKRHAGMDVVCFNGNETAGHQISHSMNAAPEMMWLKPRAAGDGWNVYHKGLNGGTNPQNYAIMLNTNAAERDINTTWNDTAPTATHFTLGNSADTNRSNSPMLALLFASVDGISKCGYYTGTGSSNAITTGFQPRLLIFKETNAANSWFVFDSVRGMSGSEKLLRLNMNNGQLTLSGTNITLQSTGFTLTGATCNASSSKWIYYAHA